MSAMETTSALTVQIRMMDPDGAPLAGHDAEQVILAIFDGTETPDDWTVSTTVRVQPDSNAMGACLVP